MADVAVDMAASGMGRIDDLIAEFGLKGGTLDLLLVCCGGGGLLSGCAIAGPTVARIFVSGGRRGLEIALAPGELARLLDASITAVAR